MVTGPYMDRDGKEMMSGGGSPVLSSTGYHIGPGHAAVFKANAKEYLSYHFYNAQLRGRPCLEIERLAWDADGWPKLGPPLPVNQD